MRAPQTSNLIGNLKNWKNVIFKHPKMMVALLESSYKRKPFLQIFATKRLI